MVVREERLLLLAPLLAPAGLAGRLQPGGLVLGVLVLVGVLVRVVLVLVLVWLWRGEKENSFKLLQKAKMATTTKCTAWAVFFWSRGGDPGMVGRDGGSRCAPERRETTGSVGAAKITNSLKEREGPLCLLQQTWIRTLVSIVVHQEAVFLVVFVLVYGVVVVVAIRDAFFLQPND